MSGIQKTLGLAQRYAAIMQDLHGEPWLVFKIHPEAPARKFGRYGCCKASEREAYQAGGAIFVDNEAAKA